MLIRLKLCYLLAQFYGLMEVDKVYLQLLALGLLFDLKTKQLIFVT